MESQKLHAALTCKRMRGRHLPRDDLFDEVATGARSAPAGERRAYFRTAHPRPWGSFRACWRCD